MWRAARSNRLSGGVRLVIVERNLLLLAAMALHDHELAPGIPLSRLLASPSEMRIGNFSVRGARICMRVIEWRRLFECVDDGLALGPDRPDLRRCEIHPCSRKRV